MGKLSPFAKTVRGRIFPVLVLAPRGGQSGFTSELIYFALNGRSRDGTNSSAPGFCGRGRCRLHFPLNVDTPAETRQNRDSDHRRQAEFQDDTFHAWVIRISSGRWLPAEGSQYRFPHRSSVRKDISRPKSDRVRSIPTRDWQLAHAWYGREAGRLSCERRDPYSQRGSRKCQDYPESHIGMTALKKEPLPSSTSCPGKQGVGPALLTLIARRCVSRVQAI